MKKHNISLDDSDIQATVIDSEPERSDSSAPILLGIFRDGAKVTLVRVIYSDETGTGSVDKEPLTVVAAVMINLDSQWAGVESDLIAIAPKKELKGSRLFRDLRNGRRRDGADRTLRDVLAIPSRHRLPIFFGAIDRRGLSNHNSERGQAHVKSYDMAFLLCLRAVDIVVHAMFDGENVLWIADQSGYEGRSRTGLSFMREIMATESPLFRSLWPEGQPHESPLVDTVYFGNSRYSRALQLADVCCSTIVRHLLADAIVAPYYDLISQQIIHSGAPIYFGDS